LVGFFGQTTYGMEFDDPPGSVKRKLNEELNAE
jgi:hypothetical protein